MDIMKGYLNEFFRSIKKGISQTMGKSIPEITVHLLEGGIEPTKLVGEGYRLYCPTRILVTSSGSIILDLRIKIDIPKGYNGLITADMDAYNNGLMTETQSVSSDENTEIAVVVNLSHEGYGFRSITTTPKEPIARLVLHKCIETNMKVLTYSDVPVDVIRTEKRASFGLGPGNNDILL